MIKIELDPYEQKDLIEYLKYAIDQKELNRPKPSPHLNGGGMKFDTTNYDIMRLEHLINEIENPTSKVNIYKPTQYDSYLTREENQKAKYQRQKEEKLKKEMEGLIEIL